MKTVNYSFILVLIVLVLYNIFFSLQKFQNKNTSFSISKKVSKNENIAMSIVGNDTLIILVFARRQYQDRIFAAEIKN